MNKQIALKACRNVQRVLKKHSPEILMGFGIVGMVATTVTAVRATPKALRLIEEREKDEEKTLTPAEVIQTTWKCYIPAVVTGTLSVACLVGASSVHAKRNAALAAAYTISETALKEYREKAIEVVGEKKEQAIRDAIAKDHMDKTPLNANKIVITGGGDSLCLDPLSGRHFMSDINKIQKAENELNRRLIDEMQLSVNDFYDELGLSHTDMGGRLGWDIEKGYIRLDISAHIAEDGRPCLVVGHYIPPIYLG